MKVFEILSAPCEDKGRKLTYFTESLIVSYKRNDNLSEILTSSCSSTDYTDMQKDMVIHTKIVSICFTKVSVLPSKTNISVIILSGITDDSHLIFVYSIS